MGLMDTVAYNLISRVADSHRLMKLTQASLHHEMRL